MDTLAGKILLAMPNMGDPRFHRAAILICAHDANGAMGLVINHPLPGVSFRAMLAQLNIHSTDIQETLVPDVPVFGGGPVENARGFILHSRDFSQADTIVITDDIAVTGTVDALRATAAGQGPKRLVFVLGYSGWTAGQLEQEIQENIWLVADATPKLIFDTNAEDQWAVGIKDIGVDLAMLSGAAGRA